MSVKKIPLSPLFKIGLTLFTINLTACQVVGTDYHRPDLGNATIPLSYKEKTSIGKNIPQGDGIWQPAQPSLIDSNQAWWRFYQSPTLNRLMEQLNQQNFNIAQAEAQYRAVQASYQVAKAGLSPTVGLNSDYTRSRGSGTTSNSTSLGTSLSWEADLWGKVRRNIEASQDKVQASNAEVAAMKLSMQTQLATNYLQLVNTDKQIRANQQNIKESQSFYQLTKNQLNAGIVAPDTFESANTQLRNVQAQLASLQLARSQYEHAIATLIGQPASSFRLPPQTGNITIPTISPAVPSVLLQRRPDIVQAERTMAAANAQIGVAQAAFYPSITLGGSADFKGNTLAKLLNLPSLVWSVGPQLALTVFDGGAIKANVEIARQNYEADVAAYRQTVLSAFQAVEDDLAAQRQLAEQANYQAQALASAKKTETVAMNQYKAGMISYLNVITARKTRLEAETTLWATQNQQLTNSVNLIVALGGGIEK